MVSAVTFHPLGKLVVVKPWTSDARRFLSEETRLRWDREQGGYLARPADVPELREVLLDEGLVMSAFRRNASLRLWRLAWPSGLWQVERTVRPEDAERWLAIFRKDEPETIFVVSARQPPLSKGIDDPRFRPGGRYGRSIPGQRYTPNPDNDDDDDLDPDGDIKSALESEAQIDADRNACVALSTAGDQEMMDLEAAGYDDQTAVVVSEAGWVVAVNGETMNWETREEWSGGAVSALLSKLQDDGFEEVPRMGGAWPGGMEIELSSEHIIRHVAHELGLNEELVERVADEVLDWGELVYMSSSNVDTTYWAKPRPR